MTAEGQLRGHPIYWDEHDQVWRYCDNGAPTSYEERARLQWKERPCGRCGRYPTPEGHDPCLGALPGVSNACCGHGQPGDAYIQFANGMVVRGFSLVECPESP